MKAPVIISAVNFLKEESQWNHPHSINSSGIPKAGCFQLLIALVVAVLFAWSGSTLEFNDVKQNGIQVAKNILLGILHPDRELLFNFTKTGIAYLLFETICIAFLGTVVGAVLAIPFSFRR